VLLLINLKLMNIIQTSVLTLLLLVLAIAITQSNQTLITIIIEIYNKYKLYTITEMAY